MKVFLNDSKTRIKFTIKNYKFWSSSLVTICSFYQVILNLNNKLIGSESDSTNGILVWSYNIANPNFQNFPKNIFNSTGYPYGEQILIFSDVTQLIPRFFLVFLQIIAEPIAAYNIFIILIFFINIYISQIFFERIARNRVLIFLFAYLISYSSYMYAKTNEHIVYTMLFIVILVFIFLMNFYEHPNFRNFIRFVLLYTVAFYFDGYYPFILSPFLLAFMLISFVNVKLISKNLKQEIHNSYFYIIVTVILQISIVINFMWFKKYSILPTRTNDDFIGFSGKLSYLFQVHEKFPSLHSNTNPLHLFFRSPDPIAVSESPHYSLLQIVLIIIMFIYYTSYIFFKKIRVRASLQIIQNSQIKIFAATSFLIITSIIFFIDFDFTLFGSKLKSPAYHFFNLFPYFRSTARGMIVLQLSLTTLALALVDRYFEISSKRFIKFTYIILLSLGVFFQSGLNPFYNNFTITKMNGRNIFYELKKLTSDNDIVSLTKWGEFSGYGMWVAFSQIKVPNSYFNYSAYTRLYENSMSISDPQFRCHQSIFKSSFIAVLDVPNLSAKKLNIPGYNLISTFSSVRNPDNQDLLFEIDSKDKFKAPKAFTSFERNTVQIINNSFSLYASKSDEIKIKIVPISFEVLGDQVDFIFGLSSENESLFHFKVGSTIYIKSIYPNKVSQIIIPMNIGDTLIIKNISSFKNNFYVTTPHLSSCY